MPERQPGSDPEGLGLSAEDLADFEPPTGEENLGDQESTLPTDPATDPDHPPAPAPTADQPSEPARPADRTAEPATPHAQAEAAARKAADAARPPSGPSTEGPPKPAAAPPATAAGTDPKPLEGTPWTPAADGHRLPIEGATVDAEGNVRIPAAQVPRLQSHLAYRPAWQERERAYLDQIRSLDPKHHRAVQLAELIAAEMEAASDPAKGGSDDTLWEWVQGFTQRLPQLRAHVDAQAVQAENARLRERLDPIERETSRAAIEPVVQTGIQDHLTHFLGQEAFKALGPQRDQLAARLWDLRDQLVGVSDRDAPELGLARGQLYLKLDVIERELGFAAKLLGDRTKQDQDAEAQAEATKRNAAARGKGEDIPPTVPVGGGPVPDAVTAPKRYASRTDWLDSMHDLAEGRR